MTEPVGPNQCFMCSGSANAFQTNSRGASNTREMTKSPLFVAVDVMTVTYFVRSPRLLFLDQDHPADTELVGDHAETRREEGFRKRHLPLAAVGQRVEPALAFGGVGRGDSQREPLKIRLTETAAVGHQQLGIADVHGGVHDLVVAARRDHRLVRRVLETHQHVDLGAEYLLVELERLVAAADEEKKR